MPQMDDAMIELLRGNRELWDIFTRKEEYNPSALDQYGRFQSCSSENKNIQLPIVSEFLLKHGFSPEYPENHSFAVCLTHDVDFLNHRLQVKLLEKVNYARIVRKLTAFTNRIVNPVWTFKDILNLEKKHNAKSTFFFQAFETKDQDFNYLIEDIERELGILIDSGCEIGLHGGFNAHDSIEKLISEKGHLEKAVGIRIAGYRNHYLKLKIPKTWRILSEAGFKYDSTMGYAETLGFRNGMCHPFRPFDLEKNEVIDILELPMNIMDGTLGTYLHLDSKSSWDVIRTIIDACRQNKGVLTVIWHNHFSRGEWMSLYEKILSYCEENSGWLTNAGQIAEWWGKNNYFEKVRN